MKAMKTFIDIYLFYMLYMISINETDVNFTWAVDKSWKDFHVIPQTYFKEFSLAALPFLSVAEIFGNYALSFIIQLYCDMAQKRQSSYNYFLTAVFGLHILMIYKSHFNLSVFWGRCWMLDKVYKFSNFDTVVSWFEIGTWLLETNSYSSSE